MKTIVLKVMLSIIVFTMLGLLVIGFVSTTNNRVVLQKELKEKLQYFTEDYAFQFSQGFDTQESEAKTIAAFVSQKFVMSEYEGNRDFFNDDYELLKKTIKQVAENDKNIISIYFTFNPKKSGGNDEIWYARKGSKLICEDTIIKADTPKNGEIWLAESEYTQYYYDAVKYNSVWTQVNYDMRLHADIATYAQSVYDKNHQLIGVVGIDIPVESIMTTVKKIKAYDSTTAMLADADMGYIAGSTTKQEYKYIKTKKQLIQEINGENNSGVINYTANHKKHILSYAKISNGWILIVDQPAQEVFASTLKMQIIIILVGVLVLIIVTIYAVVFSRKAINPIISEYEKKDIYIHSQARQAKLGEMIGIIAHQWKQPLNSMGINLSNLSDDFRKGILGQDRLDQYVYKLKLTIENMSDTVNDFSNFLKPDKEKIVFSINKEIEKILLLMEYRIKKESLSIYFEGRQIMGYGFRNEFGQTLFSVINNAADALTENNTNNRKITITTITTKNNMSKIIVHNKSKPIPEKNLKMIFEPYFTTKDDKGGTGLGLYMSKEIIEDHMNGSIDISNVEDGVECCICIPNKK